MRYLFLSDDLKLLFPDIKPSNFKALMFRMVKQGVLERICRGLYAYIDAILNDGLLLFHVVNFLRNNHFNYLSLESVLSQGGVISQIATDKINIMTSGRTYRQMVGKYGIIEFFQARHANPQELFRTYGYADRIIYTKKDSKWIMDRLQS